MAAVKGKKIRGAVALYRGRLLDLGEIAAAEQLSRSQVSDRWYRLGKPCELRPSDFALIHRKRNAYAKPCMVDGVEYTPVEIAARWAIPVTTIYSRRAKGKNVFTQGEIERMAAESRRSKQMAEIETARRKPGRTRAVPAPLVDTEAQRPAAARPRNIHDVVYEPTAMERAIMGVR